MKTHLYCVHCNGRASWSNLMETWWCADCRCDEVAEAEDVQFSQISQRFEKFEALMQEFDDLTSNLPGGRQ